MIVGEHLVLFYKLWLDLPFNELCGTSLFGDAFTVDEKFIQHGMNALESTFFQ